ncbi:unnamed protein product, partial [Amoebophrya sp. A120]
HNYTQQSGSSGASSAAACPRASSATALRSPDMKHDEDQGSSVDTHTDTSRGPPPPRDITALEAELKAAKNCNPAS